MPVVIAHILSVFVAIASLHRPLHRSVARPYSERRQNNWRTTAQAGTSVSRKWSTAYGNAVPFPGGLLGRSCKRANSLQEGWVNRLTSNSKVVSMWVKPKGQVSQAA